MAYYQFLRPRLAVASPPVEAVAVVVDAVEAPPRPLERPPPNSRLALVVPCAYSSAFLRLVSTKICRALEASNISS